MYAIEGVGATALGGLAWYLLFFPSLKLFTQLGYDLETSFWYAMEASHDIGMTVGAGVGTASMGRIFGHNGSFKGALIGSALGTGAGALLPRLVPPTLRDNLLFIGVCTVGAPVVGAVIGYDYKAGVKSISKTVDGLVGACLVLRLFLLF